MDEFLGSSVFWFNVYHGTKLYLRGLKINKKTTFSALCKIDKSIYQRFSIIFGTMGLYVMYRNKGEFLKILSVMMILVKMGTPINTMIHIMGYFLYNYVSVRDNYKKDNKRMALFPVVCFTTLCMISGLKMRGKIGKTMFIRMYLTVQYIFMVTMLYSECSY